MITPASVPVVPGGNATCAVRVRNTGTVVDSFTISVLGEAAGWTTVAPPLLSLFPGSEGTVELYFAPPRKPGLTAGPMPFGVRVVPSEDPDGSVVEEGELEVLAFQELTARITPRTSEGKRRARHDIVVDNRGNAPLEVALAASDPDEQLAFDLRPDTLAVPPGQSARATVRVAARKGFARGADKHRPFQVKVKTGPADPPTLLDATLVQKAGLPGFVFPLVAGVVALALIAAVLPSLRKDGGSGIFTLTGGKEATTTTAVAGDEGPVEDPDQAAAELEAAIAAEMAANGQDPGAAGAEPGSSGPQERVVEVAGAGGTVTAGGQPSEPDSSGGAGETETATAAAATPVATTAKPAPGATPTTTTTTTAQPAPTTTAASSTTPTGKQVSPPNGSVFNHWPRTTKLVWESLGVRSHMVEVQYCGGSTCTESNSNSYILKRVDGTTFTFDFVGMQAGRWRVWPILADGSHGNKSPFWGFRYTV